MISRLVRTRSLFLSVLLAGGCVGTVSAHTPADPAAVKDLGRLASAANLVVQSKVTRVVYKLSAPGANGSRGVPHTFVTFSISKVLQGQSSGASLTLRFIGGSDGQGGFVGVEGVPSFQVGDQDVLFVANNGGGSGCALVMCEFGRFRVFGDSVYGAHGEPVLSSSRGKLEFGSGYGPSEFQMIRYPTPSFDEMMNNPAFADAVGSSGRPLSAARAQYAAQAPKQIVIQERDSAGINGPMQADAVEKRGLPLPQFLSSVSGAVATATLGKQLAAVQSASLNTVLNVPAAVASRPPVTPGGPSLSPGPTIKKN